ncbi:putative nuclease HARBI1 [Cucumis melo var. makuwa]|uniref:Nuclease HARBI1 n=1 Tax=Cucumis melo var. makuwa TaxID=1194695 RepID=A0A5A7V7Z0_CUCMM|nr:putative nuclease HARBI1 [Cucumis melo var. makuwa]
MVKLASIEIANVEEMVSMFLHMLAHDNYLGALDDTYIKVYVTASDRSRYRTWKGEVTKNVIDVSTQKETLFSSYSAGKNPQPTRYYYLCDTGYPNAKGFLAPYRGQRYHLQEWRGVENAGGKSSAGSHIPRSSPIHTIIVCCLLHNVINREVMNVDILDGVNEGESNYTTIGGDDINYIEASNEWTQWRDDLVEAIFSEWQLCNH